MESGACLTLHRCEGRALGRGGARRAFLAKQSLVKSMFMPQE